MFPGKPPDFNPAIPPPPVHPNPNPPVAGNVTATGAATIAHGGQGGIGPSPTTPGSGPPTPTTTTTMTVTAAVNVPPTGGSATANSHILGGPSPTVSTTTSSHVPTNNPNVRTAPTTNKQIRAKTRMDEHRKLIDARRAAGVCLHCGAKEHDNDHCPISIKKNNARSAQQREHLPVGHPQHRRSDLATGVSNKNFVKAGTSASRNNINNIPAARRNPLRTSQSTLPAPVGNATGGQGNVGRQSSGSQTTAGVKRTYGQPAGASGGVGRIPYAKISRDALEVVIVRIDQSEKSVTEIEANKITSALARILAEIPSSDPNRPVYEGFNWTPKRFSCHVYNATSQTHLISELQKLGYRTLSPAEWHRLHLQTFTRTGNWGGRGVTPSLDNFKIECRVQCDNWQLART